MKCKYAITKPNMLAVRCACGGDIPAPGWKDVREELLRRIDALMPLEYSDGQPTGYAPYVFIEDVIKIINELLPAPPEGVKG